MDKFRKNNLLFILIVLNFVLIINPLTKQKMNLSEIKLSAPKFADLTNYTGPVIRATVGMQTKVCPVFLTLPLIN